MARFCLSDPEKHGKKYIAVQIISAKRKWSLEGVFSHRMCRMYFLLQLLHHIAKGWSHKTNCNYNLGAINKWSTAVKTIIQSFESLH